MTKVRTRKSKGLLLAGLLLTAVSVQAVEFLAETNFTVSAEQTLTNELWVFAETLTISGAAKEDLFATGTTLDLNGDFAGAVWSAGDTVIAAGNFEDNVRLAGRMMLVSGTLNRSLTAVGNMMMSTIKIEPSANIARELTCFGENVVAEGTVAGNARIVAQKATLGGTIHGNVSIAAQDIVILPGTLIEGDLSYTAPKELVFSPTVTLNGELTRVFKPVPARRFFKQNLGNHFFFALAALVAGLGFCKLFPHYTAGTLQILRTAGGTGMLIGIAAFVVIPMIAFFLIFTLIGVPLSILVTLFYLILLYLSRVVVALWLGTRLLRKEEITRRAITGSLALGMLIIYTLTAITAISFFINLLVMVTGLGAMLLALFKKPVLVINTEEMADQAVSPTDEQQT